ncbi:hypothetical protein D3C81_2258740 [compost metagenome]
MRQLLRIFNLPRLSTDRHIHKPSKLLILMLKKERHSRIALDLLHLLCSLIR